ncbi:MAG: NAD-dependent malic enzyme [Gammaproteobacteria bacterium]|nr:NAD-dependent malic enzyme [Gammaproteobacteria bacterium]
MLHYKKIHTEKGHYYLETSLTGKPLLTSPQLNKGTAFTEQERHDFQLLGKLPTRIETLEEQTQRAYQQYNSFSSNLNKNIYLNNLHDINQVLFYSLVSKYLTQMLPMIYTPIVGSAVKSFSREFRRPRGLYIAYSEQQHIEEILDNRTNSEIDLIVVTDGEGVLGIGDQGIGGMDIPIAKLMVYTLCAGIDPNRTLPIQLDVGTNNEILLNDPCYLGWRKKRLSGEKYDKFIEKFVNAVQKKFPHAFLHWEDFGCGNARRILEKYRSQLCTFNDDMQGTGAVTLAAILAGVKHNKQSLTEQRMVVFGAGTAGMGIADQIYDAMIRQGLTAEQASRQFYVIDRQGLLIDDMHTLTSTQKKYARNRNEIAQWHVADAQCISLGETIQHAKPTVLIGCSTQAGAFSEDIIRTMAERVERPIILPLSNPTEKCEATPADILEWTHGKALIATGSPFDAVNFQGVKRVIAQCNNALVFPGIGLGLIAAKAKRCTDDTLWTACEILSNAAPINDTPGGALLPDINHAKPVAKQIAIAVVEQAIASQQAQIAPTSDSEALVDSYMWKTRYVPFKYKASN